MTPDERQLLAGLFERTRSAAGNYRDPEAESFIADRTREQPYATYLLAQTVLVQEHALQAANEQLQQLTARVHELEQRPAPTAAGGSFLGGASGSLVGGAPSSAASVPRSSVPPSGASP